MNILDVRNHVMQALSAIAPEIDPAGLNPTAPLRDQVDLDSMDFLRLMVELHTRVGVEIPEADYGKLTSLQTVAEYLQTRLSS